MTSHNDRTAMNQQKFQRREPRKYTSQPGTEDLPVKYDFPKGKCPVTKPMISLPSYWVFAGFPAQQQRTLVAVVFSKQRENGRVIDMILSGGDQVLQIPQYTLGKCGFQWRLTVEWSNNKWQSCSESMRRQFQRLESLNNPAYSLPFRCLQQPQT